MHQSSAVVSGILISGLYLLAVCLGAAGPGVIFRVRGSFGWTVVAAAVEAPLWIGAVLIVAVTHVGPLGAIAALGITSAASLVVSAQAARSLLDGPLRFDRHVAKSLLRQGVPLGIASLLAASYYRVDSIVLAALAGTAAVGLYGAAYKFVDQARAVASYLGVAFYPTLAHEAGDEGAFRARVASVARIAATVGAVFAAVFFVGADLATRVLYGSRFAAASGLLRILAFAIFPMLLNNTIPYVMIAQRRQAIYVWINLVAFLLNVGANILLIPTYGATASAWLTAITEAVVLALSLVAIRHTLGFLPPFGIPIRAAASAALACCAYTVTAGLSPVLAFGTFGIVLSGLFVLLRVVDIYQLADLMASRLGRWRGVVTPTVAVAPTSLGPRHGYAGPDEP
jgi:O-antigen/teichoic acid export membrane protein